MKKFFTLIAVAVMAFAAQANQLTVCQGNYQSDVIPVYGFWYDTPGMSQQIYPAEMLAEMAGGDITELTFYTIANYFIQEGYDVTYADYPNYFINFYDGEITLKLMEVTEDMFVEEVAFVGAQVVGTKVPLQEEKGSLTLTIALDEPFHYNGGNLLVEVEYNGEGEYGRTYFWGKGFTAEEGYAADYYPSYVQNENYYGDLSVYLSQYLNAITFNYEAGTPIDPPVDPTVMTGSPTFNGYTEDGIYAYFVEIIPTEPSTIYYKIFIWDDEAGDWVPYGEEDWTEYSEILSFNSAGKYRIEAYAIAPDKLPSYEIAYEFVLSKITGVLEVVDGKQVANVRYFNMAGQEVQEANGLTIVVTTYTDGTTSAVKLMK